MERQRPVFDAKSRERYRNPPAPPGYQCLNPPDIVMKCPKYEKIVINFEELEEIGLFDVDVETLDNFVINFSSDDDDDIIEIPVEPVVKNIESICLSDDDGDPLPLHTIKKEKEDKISAQRSEKKPLSKVDEKRIEEKSSNQQIEEKKQNELRKKETEVKSTEQRTGKKAIDKVVIEDASEKKRDESKGRSLHSKGQRKGKKKSKLPSKSDDSDLEEVEKPKKNVKKHRSPSPLDDNKDYGSSKREYDDDDMHPASSIKPEFPLIYGSYYCDVCNLTLNSQTTYESHMTGKRHKKNMDAKNVAMTAAKSYIPTKPTSKCPEPPPGFHRVPSNSLAKIQEVVDDKLQVPCPGLDKVIEIQSLSETSYYCSLCDAPCSVNSILPHLSGFKHQLSCLKHYDEKLYNEISYKQKYQIEKIVLRALKAIEREHGKGVLKVERDVRDNETYDHHASIPSTSFIQDRPSTSSRNQPSTSKYKQDADLSEKFLQCSIPDSSKSGWYCKICDSHCNSKAMWDAHIAGKRHIANLKKAPGSTPSKSRNVPAPPGTIPRLYSYLEDVYDEPIVGLDQIREIQRLDIDSVSYTCFLCSGCICESEIVDHIISRKHREKYLEKIDYPHLQVAKSCQVSEFSLNNIIAELCERVEAEQGRGVPEVYYAKNSLLKM